MDFIQINKFGNLHNGETIIFCKTERLKGEFKKIGKIGHEVILISGNSDQNVDHTLLGAMPDNIRTWYCQNNEVYHGRLVSIPIGIENTFPGKRKDHGIAWPHALEKLTMLKECYQNKNKIAAPGLVYANFNVSTNVAHREKIRQICKKEKFIDWEEPMRGYRDFLTSLLKYEAVVCPSGNGLDTHRLYEVLYCNRIPIVFKMGNFPIYTDLYDQLPVILLDDPEELADEQGIKSLIQSTKEQRRDMKLADFSFWQNRILEDARTIVVKDTFFRKMKNLLRNGEN